MMILGVSLLVLVLLLVSFLLFATVQLDLNSRQRYASIRWGRWIHGKLVFATNDLLLYIQVFFVKKQLHPLTFRSSRIRKPVKKKKKKKKSKRGSFREQIWLMRKILSSFTVKICQINLDTGDNVTNAYLFPIFYFLNRGKHRFAINFEGKVELRLLIENRGIRVLTPFLKQVVTNFYHKFI